MQESFSVQEYQNKIKRILISEDEIKAAVEKAGKVKTHIFPLLLAVEPSDEYFEEVRAIVKVLNFVHEADVDDEIPPTSLVREFIGGNSFYRK